MGVSLDRLLGAFVRLWGLLGEPLGIFGRLGPLVALDLQPKGRQKGEKASPARPLHSQGDFRSEQGAAQTFTMLLKPNK